MPLPLPKPNESEKSFIGRCISFIMRDKPDTPQKQAIAMAYNQWRLYLKRKHKRKLISMKSGKPQKANYKMGFER